MSYDLKSLNNALILHEMLVRLRSVIVDSFVALNVSERNTGTDEENHLSSLISHFLYVPDAMTRRRVCVVYDFKSVNQNKMPVFTTAFHRTCIF